MFHNSCLKISLKALLFSFLLRGIISTSLNSPKYLFSSESNNVEHNGAEVLSQLSDVDSTITKESEEETLGRIRRASDTNSAVLAPKITAAPITCPHEEFVVRWTSAKTEFEGYTPAGALVILCRKPKEQKVGIPPVVYVSYDHGLQWVNVTDKFKVDVGAKLSLDDYFNVEAKPNFIIFLDKTNQKLYYSYDALKTVNSFKLSFIPKHISINPKNPNYVLAVSDTQMHLSKDMGKSYKLVQSITAINQFYWGNEEFGDKNTDIFIEAKVKSTSKFQGLKVDCNPKLTVCATPVVLTNSAPLNGQIVDFLVKNEYMFVTRENPTAKGSIELFVKYQRDGVFKKANVKTKSPAKEFFVYDIHSNMVMLVVNHRKNETNMYCSLTKHGIDYSLSLPRVLYHNPHTEVSSLWLRRAVRYRFVDILRARGMPWVYFATQLTVGPVGGRYLISMVTFDKGGSWEAVRGPRLNKFNQPCLYPSCSLHVNLFYGSIYRYSPTTKLMSRESAPGLIMTTGVLGANLKITPDTYISRDGGKSFSLVLRGKKRFAFGDHGGIVIATDFAAKSIMYSHDFKNFKSVKLSNNAVNIKRIFTEPGEKTATFLILATVNKKWRVFQVNATRTLGPPCTKDDYYPVNITDATNRGCEIRQIQQRNASSRCLTGPERSKVIKVSFDGCRCRRRDYRCDIDFTPDSSGGCERLGTSPFVPPSCPEGQFYNRSRGYVLIQGHNCIVDNTTKREFAPIKTPCPVTVISGATVLPDRPIYVVALNKKLVLNVTLTKGYLPNIYFDWRFGGKSVWKGRGKQYASFSKVMTKLGNNMGMIDVSNSKGGFVRVLPIVVLRELDSKLLKLYSSPAIPTIHQNVTFILRLSGNMGDFGRLQFQWKIHFRGDTKEILTSSPTLQYKFNIHGRVEIDAFVHNNVSKAFVKLSFNVLPDLKIKNVKLSMKQGNLLVVWDAINAPGYNIHHYAVKYSTNEYSFQTAPCKPTTNNPSCSILKPAAYTKYYVKVISLTADGTTVGPASDVKSIKTPMTKPGKVTSLNVFMEGPLRVIASWNLPSQPNGIITGYMYKFYKKGKVNPQAHQISDVKKTTTTFDLLDSNEDYYCEVAAKNKVGIGEYAKAGPVRTGHDVPTLPPSNFVILNITSSTAAVRWDPPRIDNKSTAFFSPKGYRIYSKENGKIDLYQTVSTSTYIFTKLTPYREYRFLFSAYVTKKEGPPSEVVTFTTKKSAPVPPTDIKYEGLRSTQVKLSWTYKGDVSFIKTYLVYQLLPKIYKPPINVSQSSTTIRNLSPYTKYVFAVKALSEELSSHYSKNVTFTTLEDRPEPPPLVELRIQWPTSSSVRISWARPFKPNGIITAYQVKCISGSEKWHDEKVRPETTFLDINHLRQLTKYTFQVYAYTKIGASDAKSKDINSYHYPFGSEHLIIPFLNEKAVAKLTKETDVVKQFIIAVSITADIEKIRIADVVLNPKKNSIEFELIAKRNLIEENNVAAIEEEMDKIKSKLMSGFEVMGYQTKPGGLKSLFTHAGKPSEDESSNKTAIIGIAVGAVIVIIILIAALIFMLRKYRQNSSYNKFDNQFQYNHQDGTVRSLSSDDNSVELRPPSYRHRKKDIESVPLADADELT